MNVRKYKKSVFFAMRLLLADVVDISIRVYDWQFHALLLQVPCNRESEMPLLMKRRMHI